MIVINFNIEYQTAVGEELAVLLNDKGTDGQQAPFRLASTDGQHWTGHMRLAEGQPQEGGAHEVAYAYAVMRDGQLRRREWARLPHRLHLQGAGSSTWQVYDQWTDIPADAHLYSAAFQPCPQPLTPCPPSLAPCPSLRLSVRAPQLPTGWQLSLCGSAEAMGAWNPQHALPMTAREDHEWTIDLDRALLAKGTEYKFIATSDTHTPPAWETGDNRQLAWDDTPSGTTLLLHLPQAHFDWPAPRLAGTLVPVFSLRTKKSFGVGDFGDLERMIEWVADTGQRVLQVLPVNDTTTTHTWTDSYPYSCISVFALHPLYADLSQLPEPADAALRHKLVKNGRELNALPQLDYESAMAVKTKWLHAAYEQEGASQLRSEEFKRFFAEEQEWLVPYAQYCYLRDTLNTVDFAQWKGHERWNEAERKALSNPRSKAWKDVAYYYYVQYVLSRQLKQVHQTARRRGVVLKGDIPIGVSRHGCDVWMQPQYFHMDGQAGAPPDDFSTNGQNWGFPTYDWEAMLADGCQWWVCRFQNMQKYFDAYRIDHVLGFFRIWEIPIDSVHGLLGQFSPAIGLTREEIQSYGLVFQEDRFTRPFIADWTLERIFEQRKEEVASRFLNRDTDDTYSLKPEYDTQRKIEAYFAQQPEVDAQLRDGLYALVSNVLFVRDRHDADKFHPRIAAQFDTLYESLWDSDKRLFDRLYNDYFYHRNNQFWYREAMKKLPRLVEATRMLVCAEDLGMVPECVGWVMEELRILSLEIESMPKDPHLHFGRPADNPYRSVCTISTHDMPTLRGWWDEDEKRTQDYYNENLGFGDKAPHPLPGWLARNIVARHLASPSMLCVISLQDWLAIDEKLRLPDANAERINIPANPRHYWRYRMHLNIEDLAANAHFSDSVRELVETHRK